MYTYSRLYSGFALRLPGSLLSPSLTVLSDAYRARTYASYVLQWTIKVASLFAYKSEIRQIYVHVANDKLNPLQFSR